jgi:hypothetical protein
MKKQTLIIIGSGVLVAVILLCMWLTGLLFTAKNIPSVNIKEQQIETEKDEQVTNQETNEINNEIPTTTITTKNKITPVENKEITLNDDVIYVNGKAIPYTPDPAGIGTLDDAIEKMAAESGGIPPDWEKATWPSTLPKLSGGTISVMMSPKNAEHQEWAAMIDGVTQGDIDNYDVKLQNSGWKTEIQTTEDAPALQATKDNLIMAVIYNATEKQCAINLMENMEN